MTHHIDLLSSWYSTILIHGPGPVAETQSKFADLLACIKQSPSSSIPLSLSDLSTNKCISCSRDTLIINLGTVIWELLGIITVENLYIGDYNLFLKSAFRCFSICVCGIYAEKFITLGMERRKRKQPLDPKTILYCCHESSKLTPIRDINIFTNYCIGIPISYVFHSRNGEWPERFVADQAKIFQQCDTFHIGLPHDIFSTEWGKNTELIMDCLSIIKSFPASLYSYGPPVEIYKDIPIPKSQLLIILLYLSVYRYIITHSNNYTIDWYLHMCYITHKLLYKESMACTAFEKLCLTSIMTDTIGRISKWGPLCGIILMESTDGKCGLYEFLQHAISQCV